MFAISGVTVQYSGVEIFSNISFVINPKDRIGLVGKNGAGKSSLLNIIAGKMSPEKGGIVIPEGKTVGYLPQILKIDSSKTIYDEAISAFSEVEQLEADIEKLNDVIANWTDFESPNYSKALDLLQEKHARFDYLDGAKRESNIEKILKGLGFSASDFDRSISEFSGGWQMRVELAKILLVLPDLILLDEPTNHLDIESIIWLEDFLKNYNGAVVMVSHDRMFLDNITNRTVEIINGKIYDYSLNYSHFMDVREERLASQLAAARNQEQFIKQQEKFIERFRAKNTKAKQVQSKIKKLEKIERIELDEVDGKAINFNFPPSPRSGQVVVEAKEAYKSYGNHEVLKDLNFLIERGERVAFVGKNGEGKTTMVKMILKEIDFDGLCSQGYNVEVGYYAQVQEKTLDENLTVFETIRNVATGEWAHEARIRGLLGSFLFDADDIDKKVKVLSGGEKSRIALAKLLLKPVNLLILDEPTNHLDISAKEVLKKALLKYDGTLILVSHDRDFLKGLTSRTFEFINQNIKEHLGDIDEFLIKHKVASFREFESEKSLKKSLKKNSSKNVDLSNKENYQQRKEQERELKKLKNAQSKLEKQINEFEKEIARLETSMQSEGFFNNPEEANRISQQHSELNDKLIEKMEEWEKVHDQVENFNEF